jgi:hypothetical protein
MDPTASTAPPGPTALAPLPTPPTLRPYFVVVPTSLAPQAQHQHPSATVCQVMAVRAVQCALRASTHQG